MVIDNSPDNSNTGINLDIVTPEKLVFSGNVDYVSIPGIEGEMGILPHHCPLITMLQPGELRIRKANEEVSLAVGGGYLEVKPDRIIILADIAERDDSIDAQKAEEAKRRAEQTLSGAGISPMDKSATEASLRLELARLKIAEKRKKKQKKIV
jgi:F-type H+-transporting ATPase subunit epsilon